MLKVAGVIQIWFSDVPSTDYRAHGDKENMTKKYTVPFHGFNLATWWLFTSIIIGTLSKRTLSRRHGGQQEDFHLNRIEAELIS